MPKKAPSNADMNLLASSLYLPLGPNASYEPTLPRLLAQPPRPAGADGAQIPQGPGLPPGATAWREAAVRKA